MKEEFFILFNVSSGDDAGYETMTRMIEEPFRAVVVKVVVDLVTQGCTIVVKVDQVSRQVNPLSPDLVSVGEYLVTRALPALIATKLWKQPDLVKT